MIFNKRPKTHLRNKILSVLPWNQSYFSRLGRGELGITALGALYEGSYFRYRSSVNETRARQWCPRHAKNSTTSTQTHHVCEVTEFLSIEEFPILGFFKQKLDRWNRSMMSGRKSSNTWHTKILL